MKRRSLAVRMLVLLSLLALTAACGGGGGGGGGSTALATGTFEKQFGSGLGSGNAAPFWAGYDMKTQHLYTAAEIGGSGMITKIRLQQANATAAAVTCPNVTMKMGHTTVSALTVTFANNVETGKGAEQTVLNNATVTIPVALANSWIDITLTTPFYYNGVDNLVVDFERATTCSATVMTTTYGAATNRRAGSMVTDATAGTPDYNAITANFLDSTQNWMQFVFAGGDDKVEFGGATSEIVPFGLTYRTQFLYLASEVSGTGPITGIGMQANATTVAASYTYTLKLGHTTYSALTTTYADNFNAGAPATIVTSGSFTIPAGVPAGEYIWIPFPGTFTYNGTDNLIVDIDVSSASAANSMRYTTGVGAGRIPLGPTGSSVASGLSNWIPNMKFRFNGGPVSVVSPVSSAYPYIFPAGPAGGVVSLYRATELGTGGIITSVACRAGANTVAGNYPSYKVIVGHTTADTLTSPADFVSQTTSYSATLSIPNTLLQGDWIEIPLSTPFAYDGKSNLLVWMGTSAAGGTGINYCSFSNFDGTRYPNHASIAVPGGATFDSPNSVKTDMKMKIQK